MVFAILGKRLAGVPYIPKVDVAAIRVLRTVEAPARGRRRRPVKCIRVLFFQDLRNNELILNQVIRGCDIISFKFAHKRKLFHFIVAAPNTQRGVMPDPAHILRNLSADAFNKLIRDPVIGACKHHVLPDHQSHLVAQVIKPVRRIESAAPHTYDIEVCQPAVFKQRAGPLRVHPREDVVLGNIVRAHGEHALSIYLHGKRLPPLVFVTPHSEGSQADAPLPRLHDDRLLRRY